MICYRAEPNWYTSLFSKHGSLPQLNGKKCKYHWKQEVSRSTKWDTARQRSLTQRWKHGCYQARTWHGGNTRANEWVGEAKLTRLHTAWCQSHEILQKTKPCRQQRISDSRQQICDCQRGRRRRRGDVEFEISRRKLSHKERWMTRLLYSTGKNIQYPGINHNGKNMKKNIYICITESLCCRNQHNTVNQLYFNKTIFLKRSMKTKNWGSRGMDGGNRGLLGQWNSPVPC